MGKKKTIVIVVLIILSFIAGYIITSNSLSKKKSEDKGMEGKSPGGADNPSKEEEDIIRTEINKMALEEKVGQLFIVGVEGDTINGSIRSMMEEYHVGGFIFMGKSINSTNQLLKLINDIKGANSSNKVPLFLSIDHEGGRVDRLPDEFRKYPSNREIGKINSLELSYDIGSAMAYEIGSLGFNMNFAPVLDVYSNPKNKVIGDRSFGTSPKVVGNLGVETMKGLQDGNIISVGKHFPGHGDTAVDSHVGLPKINKDLNQLNSLELVPFREAIKNNVDGIMIAHILLPKIDSKYPATLSKTIINDILRGKMGFKGIVITDDMTMGAISKNYKIEDAAVKSIEAGSDLILIAHDYNKAAVAIKSIINAVKAGEIKEERINESLYRILRVKKRYSLEDEKIDTVNINEINNKIEEALAGYFTK